MEAENKANSNKRLVIILVAVIAVVAIVAVAAVVILTGNKDDANDSTVNIADNGTPQIGYAEGVVAVDEDSLQAAVDAMLEKSKDGYFTTEYRNDAYSTDGENFSCYIGNSNANTYDIYIQIFADDAYSDQLFLSELLRPGTAFENITLDHPLDAGDHRVYVIFTKVGEEEGKQVIKGQVTITMDFHVEG